MDEFVKDMLIEKQKPPPIYKKVFKNRIEFTNFTI